MARVSNIESIESKAGGSRVRARGSRRRTGRNPRKGILLILLVVAVLATCVTIRTLNLKEKSEDLAVTERQLETQIKEEERKAEELKNQENFMQTNRYVEDEAKRKLGLVYPDEIVIRPADEK